MYPTTDNTFQPSEYSLWLMPSGPVRQALGDLITQLSQEFSAPLFPPHVTLLGKLTGPVDELKRQARRVADQLGPYDLVLDAVDYLDDFYRCLFVHIQKTDPVLTANRMAREVFNRLGDEPYMPHLSLLYGDFPPAVKESMMDRIGRRRNDKFRASQLYLYSTTGDTRDWQCLGEYSLTNSGETRT